jgi:hypothetical protein
VVQSIGSSPGFRREGVRQLALQVSKAKAARRQKLREVRRDVRSEVPVVDFTALHPVQRVAAPAANAAVRDAVEGYKPDAAPASGRKQVGSPLRGHFCEERGMGRAASRPLHRSTASRT